MLSRRAFLSRCAAGGLGLAAAPGAFANKNRKPNLVFILVDDLGWADLGCYGSTLYKTPHLDAWAASAVRFTQAYAASPVCSPTRAAIMTGKHPARLRITDWIPGRDPQDRPLRGPKDRHRLAWSEATVAEALAAEGYTNFFAGKWHLGGTGYGPEAQGFAINKGGYHKGSPPGGYYVPYENPKLKDGPEGEYLPDRLTTECLNFIDAHQKTPFFACLAFYTVHAPIQASKRHIDACKQRVKEQGKGEPKLRPEGEGYACLEQYNPDYASMVEAMDENVGRVIAKLRELDLFEDTLLIFTSDNGGLSTLTSEKHPAPTSNTPLRAGKGWCYEGGIRVPLLISGPGVTQAGHTEGTPVISMDFYPTILEMLGLPAKPAQHCDGLSLGPLLRAEGGLGRDTLYWHFPHYHGSAWKPGAAIREGDWKLISFFESDTIELYDLKNDPSESLDLAEEHPEKAAEMLAKMRHWRKEVRAQMPRKNG